MNINYDEFDNRYVRVITIYYKDDYSNKETFYGFLLDNAEQYINLSMIKGIKKIYKKNIKNIILIDKVETK